MKPIYLATLATLAGCGSSQTTPAPTLTPAEIISHWDSPSTVGIHAFCDGPNLVYVYLELSKGGIAVSPDDAQCEATS